jgi:hypothetical protein
MLDKNIDLLVLKIRHLKYFTHRIDYSCELCMQKTKIYAGRGLLIPAL